MSAANTNSYDIFPYESHPFAQTHPDRLATVATLLGLKPPNVTKCRVLEIGCSDGGNLIPMAVALPGSTFLGIDLSIREIEAGQAIVKKVGLANIELRHVGIEEFAVGPVAAHPSPPAPLPKGERGVVFDYIICHGVYSWVPAAARDSILDICKRCLAPGGIAYISYNCYPGWHLRGMIRDMMIYHTQHVHDPHVRVRQARNLLDFLARALDKDKSPYSLNLKAELELLRHCRDSYLFHEHLEDANEPTYFHQFAERATAKGLRYLGEADFAAMVPGNYPPEISNVLHMLAVDLVHMEQYMDFLRNRTFRQSLLCHENLTPNYKLNPEAIKQLHIASPVKPVKWLSEKGSDPAKPGGQTPFPTAEPDVQSDQAEEFKAPDGAVLASKKPIMKAAMLCLSRSWPRSVAFGELCEQARALIEGVARPESSKGVDEDSGVPSRPSKTQGVPPSLLDEDAKTLANGILTTYASLANHIIELHVCLPAFVSATSERPKASPLARFQAESGAKLTNLRHEQVELEAEFDRQLLCLLDGTRTRPEIVAALADAVGAGRLVITREGAIVEDHAKLMALFDGAYERQLGELAAHALLIK